MSDTACPVPSLASALEKHDTVEKLDGFDELKAADKARADGCSTVWVG